MGSQRVGHDWVTKHTYSITGWMDKWMDGRVPVGGPVRMNWPLILVHHHYQPLAPQPCSCRCSHLMQRQCSNRGVDVLPCTKVTKVSMIRNVFEKYHLGCSVENAVEGGKAREIRWKLWHESLQNNMKASDKLVATETEMNGQNWDRRDNLNKAWW